jgi:hypothetical protein
VSSQEPVRFLPRVQHIPELALPMRELRVLLVPPQQRHEVFEVQMLLAVPAAAQVPATEDRIGTDEVILALVILDPDGDHERTADVAATEIGNREAWRGRGYRVYFAAVIAVSYAREQAVVGVAQIGDIGNVLWELVNI